MNWTTAFPTVLAMCRERGLRIGEVRSSLRQTRFVVARRAIAKRLRADGYSYPAIGKALGGRHHTTVMHLLGATARTR